MKFEASDFVEKMGMTLSGSDAAAIANAKLREWDSSGADQICGVCSFVCAFPQVCPVCKRVEQIAEAIRADERKRIMEDGGKVTLSGYIVNAPKEPDILYICARCNHELSRTTDGIATRYECACPPLKEGE